MAGNNEATIKLTMFCLKLTGLSVATNNFEERCRYITLVYSVVGMLCHSWILTIDMYYCRSEFRITLYNLCSCLSAYLSVFKLLCLLAHRRDFLGLIQYLRRKFLNGKYDIYEKTILDTCNRTSALFTYSFTCCVQATLFFYVVNPIFGHWGMMGSVGLWNVFVYTALYTDLKIIYEIAIEKRSNPYILCGAEKLISGKDCRSYWFRHLLNIGRNESDRMLLFNIQMDLPFTTSPYFEMTFLVQAFLLYQIGLCYFCFDNILCITNLHVAGQFRILQYRLENMIISDDNEEHDESGNKPSLQSKLKYYTIFKTNVRQHQALIAYCKLLEKVYSLFSLGQVLLFSLIICLDGYQLIMPETSAVKRFLFLFRIFSCNAQLLMFTYSCDCLIQDSANVASAMYAAPWSHLPMNEDGKMLRKELILVMMRSRVPCYLTARGFFIVSLETYTKVLSTAVSYFTLLRQRGVTTQ